MEVKIVKVSDKGQISLPVGMRESVNIQKGDEVLVVKNGKEILIKKFKHSDFSDLLRHSEKVAKKLWDNIEDEVWNEV